MSQHSKLTPTFGGVHTILAYEYADALTRTGATGFDAKDIGKVALQEDNGTYWILQSILPTVWVQMGQGAPAVTVVPFDDTTTTLVLGAIAIGQILVFGQISVLALFDAGTTLSLGTVADPAMFLSVVDPPIGAFNETECREILVDDFLVLTVDTSGLIGNGKLYYEVH